MKKRAGQEINEAQKTAVSTFKTDLTKLGEHNVKDYAATVRNLYKTLNKTLTYEIDESLKQISFKSKSAVVPDLHKTIASVVRGNARNNYVIYKDGKHVGLDNYMEMRLRTDINHEISTEMVQINQEIGQVFYMCSEHGNCADDHLDYQGKIYCSENWEDTCPLKFHDQVADYIKQNDIMSVEDAMGEKGNYLTTRPNCRHYFQMVAITDVLSLKTEKDKKEFKEENGLSYKTSYKENDYKALQTQRLNERNIRKFKRLESAEKAIIEGYDIGSPERIAAENRRKEYSLKKRAFQKKQRELMKAHPSLDRDYGREALDRFRKYDPKDDGNKMDFNESNKAFYKSRLAKEITDTIKRQNDINESEGNSTKAIYSAFSKEEQEDIVKKIKTLIPTQKVKVDGIKSDNVYLYFGKGKKKNPARESTIEHIINSHYNQINEEFMMMFGKAVQEAKFNFDEMNKVGGERYVSKTEFINQNVHKKYFYIVADKDTQDNLRIVTAYIKKK